MHKWPPHIPGLGDAVKKYIEDGNSLSIRDRSGVIKELEDRFAAIHGKKYALTVSSGTMALCSAFFAIDPQPGDEIICTAFSFHATASSAHLWGLNVVFCDVESDTGNIDSSKLESLITPRTRAVVSNDMWGHPCDKDAILALCRKYDILYIEDCSHAHFSEYKGKYSGTFGDIACWSFQSLKFLSGGEGGILLTDNFAFYERAVLLGHYSWRSLQTAATPGFTELGASGFGLKLRMHPLAAVMVLYQLENCSQDWLKSRHETLTYFEKRLRQSTPLLPMTKREYVTSMGAWFGFYPRCDFIAGTNYRDELMSFLRAKGLVAKKPPHLILPYMRLFHTCAFGAKVKTSDRVSPRFPQAELYDNSIIGFPTFTFHEYNTINKYIGLIASFFAGTHS